MGSVKDFTVIEPATQNSTGRGVFNFSDRYSVFDWGEMPDHIYGKGAALCITSAYFFERLEEEGVKTHYLGVVEDGKPKRLKDLKGPQGSMEVKLVRVVRPRVTGSVYDYKIFKNEKNNFLIPLEVIYRNSLPEGSSVFKRLKDGSLKLESIGLKEMPTPGTKLNKPIFDVSTKMESTDRYLSWDEAKDISGLSEEELFLLQKNILRIDELLTKEAGKAKLTNEDGKVEFGFDENREMILLDTVGTLDECRFTYGGVPVSKEILRMNYRGTPWHNEVEEAKRTGGVEWKKTVVSRPERLSAGLSALVSELYKAACNEITGRLWFKNMRTVEEVLREITK
ncbi:MAG: phosphoribosylaminoimidazolesuccinocarboxamide synthase [Deltaproteobacteria bacterium CG11_big_fil_rev_8_21_14_0_20_49_13]|nr:MAG: phosphoribosylaminoimidazolesuccinocarboxamide synthase [Deltaproteobacteria bacterium CG11_big_fil_rev_8_21_14_0_20_49_13]